MKNKINENLWCEYSNLPSPASYMNCTDYDGMGNQGRVNDTPPKIRNKNWNQCMKVIKSITSGRVKTKINE